MSNPDNHKVTLPILYISNSIDDTICKIIILIQTITDNGFNKTQQMNNIYYSFVKGKFPSIGMDIKRVFSSNFCLILFCSTLDYREILQFYINIRYRIIIKITNVGHFLKIIFTLLEHFHAIQVIWSNVGSQTMT